MNCSECQNALERVLDGESFSDADLAAHLHDCSDCRELHAAAARLLNAMRMVPLPPLPPDLSTRITSAVLADRFRIRRRRIAVVTGLAAAVLLASLIGPSIWRRADSHGRLPPIARVEIAPKPAPAPSFPDAVEDAGRAVLALTREVAAETVGEGRTLFSLPASDARDKLPQPLREPLDPPVQSFRSIQEGVSAGLEPVTTSARRAVDLFLRELPINEPKRRPGV
jgi:hypothetical protein